MDDQYLKKLFLTVNLINITDPSNDWNDFQLLKLWL